MTNEEAKVYLRNWRNAIESRGDTDFSDSMQSLSIAISALENIDRITAERDAFMKDFKEGFKAQIKKGNGIYRCDICKHGSLHVKHNCPKGCDGFSHWEWRGLND